MATISGTSTQTQTITLQYLLLEISVSAMCKVIERKRWQHA